MAEVRLATDRELRVAHAIQLAAFAESSRERFPSSALREGLEVLRAACTAGGVVVATVGDRYVGAGRFAVSPESHLSFERLAVLPGLRGRGFGVALVQWMESHALSLGLTEVRCDARSQMPDNRGYYERLGYSVIGYSGRYGIPDIRTHMSKRLAFDLGG